MDAQTLGALATIVNEAIAKAVGPLQARVAELEGRPAYDPKDVLGQIKSLRDGWDGIAQTLPAPYDDSALSERLKTLEVLASPDVQDDTLADDVYWKLEERLKALVPAAYDDSDLRERVQFVAGTVPKEIEAMLCRIKDARYDDTALRAELAELKKSANDWGDMRDAFDKHAQQVERQLAARPAPIDGRDALQLEVLPAIDEQKSYQRGTYAKHAGGLWRSFEQTSGLRGWECIVEGVKALRVTAEGKEFTVTAERSSGSYCETKAFIPVQVYKGVFDGSEYEHGDTVTWAGSLWHCNVTATKAKPGDGSTDWTLAVKKGRDGKEVVVLPPAEPKPVRVGGVE